MKAETDDIVRLQRAWRSLSLGAVPQESCPDPESLWEAVRGEAGAGEVRQVIEHTANCGACAEAWRLARELAPAVAIDRRPGLRPAHQPWRAASWGIAAAAAMVLAVVGLQWRNPVEPAPPPVIYRGAETAAVRSLVPPGTTLSRQDFVLRWEGPEGARYRLRVNTEDLMTVVAEVWDLEATKVRVPEEDLAAVPPGSRLYWQVEARLPGGGTSTSESFEVRVE